jgi:hypothetical protein
MPVILATWESVILDDYGFRSIMVQVQPSEKGLQDPISTNSLTQWHAPVISKYAGA